VTRGIKQSRSNQISRVGLNCQGRIRSWAKRKVGLNGQGQIKSWRWELAIIIG